MKFKILTIALLALGLFLAAPVHSRAFTVFGNNKDQVCNTDTSTSPVCQPQANNKNPAIDIINTTANIVALLAGVLAVIMIIISGFTLITSAGNQEAVTNSRKRITSSIAGIIIVSLAWVIVRFITDHVIQ